MSNAEREPEEESSILLLQSDPESIDKDEDYYLVDVIFLVEGTLFRVPRAPFEYTSEVFSDMFRFPVLDGQLPDGSSDEQPLRLDGIKKKDFRLLLKVLVPRSPQLECMSWEEWFSVLDLAIMWEMDQVKDFVIEAVTSLSLSTPEWIDVLKLSSSRRGYSKIFDKAVDKLTPSVRLPPIDRILLARECKVAQWLSSGYKELAERNEIISIEEEERLGVHATVKIFRMQLTQDRMAAGVVRRRHYGKGELEELIRISFIDELKGAEYTTP